MRRKSAPRPQERSKPAQRLWSAASPFFWPMYWEIWIPAMAVTAPRATLPSCPTMTWSIMEKEDWSMDCRATGTAMAMTFRKKDSFFFIGVSLLS